ncbi:XcbB/CpsF family capsular polysaccharide biosynthesis protein [Cytobacillus sp. FSL R5-0569]|uniref:XcbB/CpsF family capsular polysaccharide biosynthesis protein n=1 Tax=Cytobacillus sp. FSL R5-0569 TaxID=2921649 RepID=UPI0030FB5CB5
MGHEFTVSETNILDFKPDYTKDKLFINTFQNKSLLNLAREYENAYKMYKEIISKDYILYYHDKNNSRFCKRGLFENLWVRKDLIKQGELFYSIDEQIENKETILQRKKLLVIFSCMPRPEDYDSSLTADRCFTPFFKSIARSLVKDVIIMRIMDLNLSHGSHYINTYNYPNMEDDVQAAIEIVSSQYNIEKENILLYGVSKGGTGALYHGSKNDYKVVAVDPIISLEEYNNNNDEHFLVGLRKVDLIEDINSFLSESKLTKFVIGNENVKFNYKKIMELNDKVEKVILKDDKITHHNEVSRNCVPEQLTLLNMLLSETINVTVGKELMLL